MIIKTCYVKLAQFLTKYSFQLKVLCFPLYYAVGLLYYHFSEGWSILETTYFITVTITTCGYGFFHPTNEAGKVFTIFYMLVGLIVVVTVIFGLMNSVVFDAQDQIITFTHRLRGLNNVKISKEEMRFLKVQYSLIAIFLMIVIGSSFFTGNEGWTVIDSVYWTVCTMTTVGYGDLEIKYKSTRVFAIFYIYGCVILYAAAASNLIDVYKESVESAARITDNDMDLTQDKFNSSWTEKVFAGEKDSTVSKAKLILLTLLELGVIDEKHDIRPIKKVRDNLSFIRMDLYSSCFSSCLYCILYIFFIPFFLSYLTDIRCNR
jgi:voltage-gated potassium channel